MMLTIGHCGYTHVTPSSPFVVTRQTCRCRRFSGACAVIGSGHSLQAQTSGSDTYSLFNQRTAAAPAATPALVAARDVPVEQKNTVRRVARGTPPNHFVCVEQSCSAPSFWHFFCCASVGHSTPTAFGSNVPGSPSKQATKGLSRPQRARISIQTSSVAHNGSV
jgi:hypothetical protein